MSVNTKIYNQHFFQNTVKFEAASAQAAVGILIKYFHPKSVIDLGCGCGVYLAEFQRQNVDIMGFDGSPAALSESLVGDKIKRHDLCRPLKLSRRFALGLCFEVAEHLAADCADILVKTIVNSSEVIIFTAATPGQGPRSIGHINEQPPQYWVEKFAQRDYYLEPELTEKIRKEMEARSVVWWVVKNLMVFKKIKDKEAE